MNKVILYVGFAILLGTVTMAVPLALLGSENTIQDDTNYLSPPEYIVTVPESTDPNNQERDLEEGGLLENGDFSAQGKTPEPEPAIPMEPSETPPETDGQPQEAELVTTAENPLDLSSVGFLMVPSFLVAFGVFVYLKKRIY